MQLFFAWAILLIMLIALISNGVFQEIIETIMVLGGIVLLTALSIWAIKTIMGG